MRDLDRDIWESEKSATRPEFHSFLNGPVYSAKVKYTVYHVRIVRDHKGLGCNFGLIECTLGPGKPKGGWDFGREGTRGQMGNKGS